MLKEEVDKYLAKYLASAKWLINVNYAYYYVLIYKKPSTGYLASREICCVQGIVLEEHKERLL